MNVVQEGVEVGSGSMWLREGFVHVAVYPDAKMSLADAKESISALETLCGGGRKPILIDVSGSKPISRDARVHYAGEEAARVHNAVAMVVKSPITRAIGNLFLGLNKPLVPTRLFDNDTEAAEWLKRFL